MRLKAIGALAFCVVWACTAPETAQREDVSENIGAANKEFMAAFARGDAAALASLYTEDGKLLPPNSDFVTGRVAIQEFWQGVMDAGVAQAELTLMEAEGFGDTAVEVSRYALMDSDGNPIDEGKYIVIWKRTDAGWRLHRDIWNSSRPIASE